MLSPRSSSVLPSAALALAAGLAISPGAHGAAITWNNAGGTNLFNLNGNWAGGVAPKDNDEAIINLANAAPRLGVKWTVDKLTLKDINSASMIIDGTTLTTKTQATATKGNIQVNGTNTTAGILDAQGNGVLVDAGTLTLDAPATAGEAKVQCTGTSGLTVNGTGTVQVNAGKGGARTIAADLSNAGNMNINASTVVKSAAAGGDVTVANTGTIKMGATGVLQVQGGDLDISQFTMSGGKMVEGAGISMSNLTFNYTGGDIRNPNDTGTGGINFRNSVINLVSTRPVFATVNGSGSIIANGVPGTGQTVSFNAGGDAAPVLSYTGNFNNKGTVSLNTGGTNMAFSGTGGSCVNNGTMNFLGNGKAAINGLAANRPGAKMNMESDVVFNTPAALPAAAHPYNAGTITFTKNGATLTTDRTLDNNSVEGTKNNKGTIGVKDKTVKATIVTPGGKVKGGDLDTKQVTPQAPRPGDAPVATQPTLTRGSSAFSPTLTFVGGYEQDPDSVWYTSINGNSSSSFDVGTLGVYSGQCLLAGTMSLELDGIEPAIGSRFTMIASDQAVLGQFDFGDTLYPIGGSGDIKFQVLYNDASNTDSPFNVTLVAEPNIPTPGAALLAGIAGLLGMKRRRA